ncbi:MAG TPA: hypothetical protein VHH36_04010, partial [Candidatus Thermoplasmatota archaeon]|nr:hypothetical protein [Candidatus Thermoplasmatota archaeon]
ARASLGLDARGDATSPSARAFWRAADRAREIADRAPLDALLGSIHLAHARPFDLPAVREVDDACAAHVLRLLHATRPQAVVTVGADALATLAAALDDRRLADFARAPEASWAERYPPGTRVFQYPYADVPAKRPFRARVVPVPSLSGAAAERAGEALAGVMAQAMG